MVSEGSGYGKVILFGEHFVVHGVPAIVAALKKSTIAKVEDSDGFEVVDNRPATPGYKDKKKEQAEEEARLHLEGNPNDKVAVAIIDSIMTGVVEFLEEDL